MVKEKKLYDILGVSPTADENEIKKGYRKAALKYHPDKPTGNTEKFKEVSEAFDILSDSNKRQVYDDYGLEAARGNAPAGGNPFEGAGGGHPFGGQGGGFHSGGFSNADAFNIFSQMGGFGMNDGFGGNGGFGGGASPFGNGGFGGSSGYGGGMPGGFGGSQFQQQQSRRKPETITKPLPVSLEDLYNGNLKKIRLTTTGRGGAKESEVVEIQLKPGWKAGTKLTFDNVGDYQEDAGARQSIQFVLEEKPHPTFKREGDNLKMELPLTFREALCGFDREITTIDGRKLPYSRSTPVQPNSSTTYPGLGMPISKQPGSRGDLEIVFKINFPTSLTQEQKLFIMQNF
ncbi:hypothetical protein DFJ63DRAFT_120712 [Scheffersomyces coipomensis]|uniref:uncharacterized protein n=1 Tax=Scheffersomyces coipomensis TaxID=1788519 RepID=UPI00315CD334